MPEVSGTEFLESASKTEPDSREFKLADGQNRYISVELHEVGRQKLFDELNRLPSGFIDAMMAGAEDVEDLDDVDDPEDIDIDVDGGEILSYMDGDTIDVFESLFAMSASHPDLTSIDMETLAGKLSFEVLFEAGGEIIDMSLSDQGEIKRFREPGSARSS